LTLALTTGLCKKKPTCPSGLLVSSTAEVRSRSSVTASVAVLPAGTFSSKREASRTVWTSIVVSTSWNWSRTGCSISTARPCGLRLLTA
jgi:hypothetical protein